MGDKGKHRIYCSYGETWRWICDGMGVFGKEQDLDKDLTFCKYTFILNLMPATCFTKVSTGACLPVYIIFTSREIRTLIAEG